MVRIVRLLSLVNIAYTVRGNIPAHSQTDASGWSQANRFIQQEPSIPRHAWRSVGRPPRHQGESRSSGGPRHHHGLQHEVLPLRSTNHASIAGEESTIGSGGLGGGAEWVRPGPQVNINLASKPR